jgi:hypothetical protein
VTSRVRGNGSYRLAQAFSIERVVTINRRIKAVITASTEVNIVALNAGLVARRAGGRSRGFLVVAGELRAFSGHLQDSMSALMVAIFGLVGDVAQLQKQLRSHRGIATTAAFGGRAAAAMASAQERAEAAVAKTTGGLHAAWDGLLMQSQQALRLCRTGLILAKGSKIEAAHGGDMASALQQIADHIEATVERVHHMLTDLVKDMERSAVR